MCIRDRGDVDEFEGRIRRNVFDPLDQLFCLADCNRRVDQNGFGLPLDEGTGDWGKETWFAISVYSKLET